MTDQEQSAASSNVFISYSRKNKKFAQKLNDSLDSSGIEAWVDWEGIPLSSDWMDEITRAIEGADAFLFIISPDSLASEVCAEELELSLKYNKKLIPILHIEPEKGSTMHEALAATNWVYMREQDDYDATLPGLIESIHTDLGWVRQHTRLLKRAKEWESKNKNSSFLLQGSDLNEAETWMVDAANQESRVVVPLQGEFIQTSRQAATRRQRNLLIGVSLALLVSIGLAIFALFQRGIALEQTELAQENEAIAVANEHARATQQVIAEENEAQAIQNEIVAKAQRAAAEARIYQTQAGELDTSTLLAIDSWQREPSFLAEDILRRNTSLSPVPIAQVSHSGRIWHIELSPDGESFATSSSDHTVCVWAMEDASQYFCVEHDDIVYDVLYNKDGSMMMSAGEDGTVRLWDAADGNLLKSYDFNGTTIWDLEINPDGSQLAVARDDSYVSIIDLNNLDKKPRNLKQEEEGGVYKMAYSPDGEWLGVATSSGKTFIWNMVGYYFARGAVHLDEVYAVDFSPDSTRMISGGADSAVRMTRTRTGDELFSVTHGDWVEDLIFGPDGSWFAVAADDNNVWIWDAGTGVEKLRMQHDGFVQKVEISASGEWIATTGYDQTVRIWDSSSGSEMMQIPLDANGSAIRFSEDETHLIVGDHKGNIGLWDISHLLARLNSIEFSELVREARFSPSGEWLVANTDQRDVRILPSEELFEMTMGAEGAAIIDADGLTYDMDISPNSEWVVVAEREKKRAILYSVVEQSSTYLAHGATVRDVAFHPDSAQVATVGDDAFVSVWDVATAEEVYVLENPAEILSVAFEADGTRLAVGLVDQIIIWDLEKKEKFIELKQTGEIESLAYSPDGAWLATASLEGTIYLWDVQNNYAGNSPTILRMNGQPQALEFSPDSSLLAVGSSNYFAYLWDVSIGQEVSRLPHSDVVRSVSFSPDGNMLATASRKVVQFWDVAALPIIPTDELIEAACSHLMANLSQSEWEVIYASEEYRLLCSDLPVKE